MRKLVWLLIGVGLLAGTALAFDLPRIIGEINYDYPPDDFCCIGDQNGDGKSELLVAQFHLRRYEIYLGSNQMGAHYAYSMPSLRGESEAIRQVLPVGNLMPDHSKTYLTLAVTRNDSMVWIDFYSGVGNGRDSLWSSWRSQLYLDSRTWFNAPTTRPFDFNGDGYDDVLFDREVNDSVGAMELHYGGANLDSIPDWSVHFTLSERTEIWNYCYCAGFDVNGDGYDDFLVAGSSPHGGSQVFFFALFLGGERPDTTAAWVLWDHSLPGQWQNPLSLATGKGFSLLKDVNSDGYDDIAIGFTDNGGWGRVRDGVLLFYGGEHISDTPNVVLQGNSSGYLSQNITVVGGDFNGDGRGDLATGFWNSPPPGIGEIHYYFGSDSLRSEPDLTVLQSDYNGRYSGLAYELGAVGDYNGDGADDLVCCRDGGNPMLFIMAGDRRWRLGVNPPVVPTRYADPTVTISPSPFNQMTRVECTLTVSGYYTLKVYDVMGRLCTSLFEGERNPGHYSVSWSAASAGVYLVVLKAEDGRRFAHKAVCLP